MWIEILDITCQFLGNESLPVRECGLKYLRITVRNPHHGVTPCAGVWIEIGTFTNAQTAQNVTPCAGVWIEILNGIDGIAASSVTPCAGVWIEIMKALSDGIKTAL